MSLSQFQKKAEYELELCRAMHQRYPTCQLCGRGGYLHFHHIINRSFIPKKLLNDLPIVFHALLCEDCHLNQRSGPVDTPPMRAKLIAKNAKLYGWNKVEEGFETLAKMLPNGYNKVIVDIEDVKKIYEQSN